MFVEKQTFESLEAQDKHKKTAEAIFAGRVAVWRKPGRNMQDGRNWEGEGGTAEWKEKLESTVVEKGCVFVTLSMVVFLCFFSCYHMCLSLKT